jgi:hypothetical protein
MRSIGLKVSWCALALVGCMHVDGELRTVGAFGDRALAAQACASGDARGFFGVDLRTAHDGSTALVRIVDDPLDGRLVRIYRDGERGPYVDFTERECAAFTVQVRQHGAHTRGVHYMGGELALDCRAADGTTLQGRASFDWCSR